MEADHHSFMLSTLCPFSVLLMSPLGENLCDVEVVDYLELRLSELASKFEVRPTSACVVVWLAPAGSCFHSWNVHDVLPVR